MALNQHTDDFKLNAVEHYLENRDEITIQDTCDIFKCSERSLRRWINRYLNEGEVARKVRTSGAYKVTVKQLEFLRKELNKYPDIAKAQGKCEKFIRTHKTRSLLELLHLCI